MAEAAAAAAAAGAALGRGAWDCTTNTSIPPEKEAEVFEEVATMDHAFEGIPTIPPRTDTQHMSAFASGTRYRAAATPDMLVGELKRRLWEGGMSRAFGGAGKPADWSSVALLYAMQLMADDQPLSAYHVPPGCKVLVALEVDRVGGEPAADSAYWN